MHYSVASNTIKYVGDWTNQGKGGLKVFDHEAFKADDNHTETETLVVVTKEETPYVLVKEGKSGNSAYDGFAIDLLKASVLFTISAAARPSYKSNARTSQEPEKQLTW